MTEANNTMTTLKMHRMLRREWIRIDNYGGDYAQRPMTYVLLSWLLLLIGTVSLVFSFDIPLHVQELMEEHALWFVGAYAGYLLVGLFVFMFLADKRRIVAIIKWGERPDVGSRKFSIVNGMKEHFGVDYNHDVTYAGNIILYDKHIEEVSK